jgi:hypothetical protein
MSFCGSELGVGSSYIRRERDVEKTSKWLEEGDKQRELMVSVSCNHPDKKDIR